MLPVGPDKIFPSHTLLDHIPSLIVDISGYVRLPETEAIAANTLVMNKARELGELRHRQQASLHQVLREYQLLAGILQHFIEEETIRLRLAPDTIECMAVMARVHQAVDVLLQETVETFVGLYTDTITKQTERLRQFARMATHEWRQPLAPITTAVSLLRLPALSAAQHGQTLDMIARNVSRLSDMTRKLESLARLDGETDTPERQQVSITVVAQEAARQLREMADTRNVDIRIAADMPAVVVDVGRLELTLVNLVSNAIKYSAPDKAERWVDISAVRRDDGGCVIRVTDNGVGIPESRRSQIFRRFTRAHTDHPELESVGGVGLGLAIVDDCVSAMRGSIIVESVEGRGTTFTLTLPVGVAADDPTPQPAS